MMQTSSSGIKKEPARAPKTARLNSALSVFVDTVIRCKNPLILYFVAMFIFGPVSLLVSTNWKASRIYLQAPLLPLGCLVTAGASVVIPLVVFSYLDNKRALDVFHSLPVTRGKMFAGNFLAGLVMLLAPYLLMAVPTGIALDINEYFRIKQEQTGYLFSMEYLPTLLQAAAVVFFCYVLMTLLVVCCSTLLESVGYFAIILLGYVGLVTITFNLVGSATYGYTKFPLQDFLMRFSPLSVWNGDIEMNWGWALQLFITALVLVFLCYRRVLARKSEQVGGGYVWPPLYYAAAIGGSIAVGLVSVNIFGMGGASIFLSVVLGILFYAILDIIRNRGFKNIIRAGIVGVCTTIGVGVIALVINVTGTFGYEQWMPKEDEIVSVSVSCNTSDSLSLSPEFALSDTASIQKVLSCHKSILANQSIVEDYDNTPGALVEYTPYIFDHGDAAYAYGSQSISISYTLKNGKSVSRRYYGVPTSLTKPLTDIAGSQVYSCAIADELDRYADYIDGLTSDQKTVLNKYYGSSYQLQLIDTGELGIYYEELSFTADMQKELLYAFAEDLRRRPEGWKTNPDTQPIGSLYMCGAIADVQYLDTGAPRTAEWYDYTFFLYETDINTLSFLEELGYYDGKELLPNRTYTHYNDCTQIEAMVISTEYYDLLKEGNQGNIFHFAGSYGGVYSVLDDEATMFDEPGAVTISEPNYYIERTRNRYFLGNIETGTDVTDQVVNREFTDEEIESLWKLTLQVAISDEPMNVLSLNGCNYLIPDENLAAVKEIVYGGGQG